jgi:acetylornithine/succinyldiaminopimelate/putrescine aminotransferase
MFESNKNIAAILLEPIQGERGVIIPDTGYL